jgi:hypothetical protein
MSEPDDTGAIEFGGALALPCEHMAVFTPADPGDTDIHILMQRGEGGLYVTYCPHSLRVLAEALLAACDHTERLASLAPTSKAQVN